MFSWIVWKVFLFFQSKTLLKVNQIFGCNPDTARKLYRAPDNRFQDRLKRNMLETAETRRCLGSWSCWSPVRNNRFGSWRGSVSSSVQVPIREPSYKLFFSRPEVPDSVEKVLKPIISIQSYFFPLRSDGLQMRRDSCCLRNCKWMDEEVEHGVTSLTEIHMKMEELDPMEDKSLTNGRMYLEKKDSGTLWGLSLFHIRVERKVHCVAERHYKGNPLRLPSTGHQPLTNHWWFCT